jgi:protein-L-isoaspartate(D-aspartate) O-methyltransferase
MQGEVAATEQVLSAQRRAMVDGQIRTFDVTDARVVRAFDLTRRELFLPEELRPFSYSDATLTLKSPETGKPVRALMQPMHLARMLQAVDPAPDSHVLVVAGGAGYAAAVLLEMVASVVTLESDAGLSRLAAAALVPAGARATVVTGPLAEGWRAEGPYDAILVLGGVEANLGALLTQLKPHGTLAAVATTTEHGGRRVGRVTLYTVTGTDVSARAIFDANVPVLSDFKVAPGFTF